MIFEVLLRPQRSAVYFSARTLLATVLALLIAFVLKLDSPQWAAITVWIVAQPSKGMTLSKGFYRLIGTLVGACVAVLLISTCGNKPWLFLLILSLWMGVTAATSNLVRYLRSYGAVLAGYTASIVALLVFSQAEHIWEVAQSRIICVLLGIGCATFIAILPGNGKSKKDLFIKLQTSLSKILLCFANVADRQSKARAFILEKELLSEITSLEESLSYAVMESLQIRLRQRVIQELITRFIATMSSIRAVEALLQKKTNWDSQVLEGLVKTSSLAKEFSRTLKVSEFQQQLPPQSLVTELKVLSLALQSEIKGSSLLAERVADLAENFATLIHDFDSLSAESRGGQSSFFLNHYRDWRIARIAGLRSLVGVLTGGVIWLSTGWTIGPFLVVMAAVNCGLFANRNDPLSALATTMKASLWAYALAFVGLYTITLGAPVVAVYLAAILCLFPAGLLIADTRTSLTGVIFAANFLVFLSPSRLMLFNLLHYRDLGLGFFGGLAVSWLVFKIFSPPTAQQQIDRLRQKIVLEMRRMASGLYTSRTGLWETGMYRQVSHLMKLAVDLETSAQASKVIEGGLAALHVGREISRLQDRLGSPLDSPALQNQMQTVLRLFSQADIPPSERIRGLEELALATQTEAGPLAEQQTRERLAALIHEINDGLERYPEFFKI